MSQVIRWNRSARRARRLTPAERTRRHRRHILRHGHVQHVAIRRNADGVIRIYHFTYPGMRGWDKNHAFWWGEGNACCDCNRGMDFARAGGMSEEQLDNDCNEDNEELQFPCGHERYTITSITQDDDRTVLYTDHERDVRLAREKEEREKQKAVMVKRPGPVEVFGGQVFGGQWVVLNPGDVWADWKARLDESQKDVKPYILLAPPADCPRVVCFGESQASTVPDTEVEPTA